MQHKLADVPEPKPRKPRIHFDSTRMKWTDRLHTLRMPPSIDIEKLITSTSYHYGGDDPIESQIGWQIYLMREKVQSWHYLLDHDDSIR